MVAVKSVSMLCIRKHYVIPLLGAISWLHYYTFVMVSRCFTFLFVNLLGVPQPSTYFCYIFILPSLTLACVLFSNPRFKHAKVVSAHFTDIICPLNLFLACLEPLSLLETVCLYDQNKKEASEILLLCSQFFP